MVVAVEEDMVVVVMFGGVGLVRCRLGARVDSGVQVAAL